MPEQTIILKGGAEVTVDLGIETKCRCGAYICWAKTKVGKTMPINVIPPLNKGDIVEWESHFASCPDAEEFRKPKKEKEMKPKTIKDIIRKIERKFIIVIQDQQNQSRAQEKFNEFLTTEITELLAGLKGEMKELPKIEIDKPDFDVSDFNRKEGSNQRETQLREDIKQIK